MWGFFKKLIIADRIAIPVNELFENAPNYNGFLLLLGTIMYGIQVYTDFSAGMEIARGFSQMLSIDLDLNFNQPYHAISIEDFWRRWHITLGSFMKDYVFYPLSLSKLNMNLGKKCRKLFGVTIGKKIPIIIVMFIVYLLVGFWHGAEWKYVAYGIWNGTFIASTILLEPFYNKLKKALSINDKSHDYIFFQWFRTFVIVSLGRLFPRAPSLMKALFMMGRITTGWWYIQGLFDKTLLKLGLNTAEWLVLVVGIIILFIVDYLHEHGKSIRNIIANQSIIVRWAIYYAIIIIIVVFGVYGPMYGATSFIYQQF